MTLPKLTTKLYTGKPATFFQSLAGSFFGVYGPRIAQLVFHAKTPGERLRVDLWFFVVTLFLISGWFFIAKYRRLNAQR